MQTAKRTTIMVILALLTVGPGQSAEESARKISNTLTANCLVKITCDQAILPPDSLAVSYLVRSSAVAEKAAREVLGIAPEESQDSVEIQMEAISSSESAAMSMMSPESQVLRSGLRPRADEYMMEEYMMEEDMMREEMSPTMSTASRSARATTVRRPGESTAQYEARQRAQAAARARAEAAARSRRQIATSRSTLTQSSSSAADGTMLFRLQVNLEQGLKPMAREFMSALVDNLRDALLKSRDAYVDELHSQLSLAEHNRDKIEAQLAEATSHIEAVRVTPPLDLTTADVAVREQLEQIVDLSDLKQEMAFNDVIAELKNSVDPPLQIQPNWKDLLDTAEIEPTTPAMMDPLSSIKLRKALELLLAGVSSESAKVGYVVDDGVIVIATEDALPRKMLTCVYEIPALARSQGGATGLVRTIQQSVEPNSWFDLSDTGKGTISISIGNKLAIYQTYDVHEKIFQFLKSMTVNIPVSTTVQNPPEMLLSEKHDLLREKQGIEMDVARLRARQTAIEMQIVQMSNDLVTKAQPPDPVVSQLEQLVEMHTEQLKLMEKQAEVGRLTSNELADVKEKLTRAKIDLAKRRQETSVAAGSARAEKYNDELADLTIELAEKTAALQVLDKQLGQTEQQLTAATMVDPQLSRVRAATRMFEIADQRINELNALIANLQPPVVSMLGAE